jgi:DNA-binding GntR family transcriptional regulator
VGRETIQDRVYRQLVAMILDGEIEPGRTVTITDIAEAFGVSAMPVRGALHRLTAAKVLTVIAGRSVGIPPLTIERLSDIARVRGEVEGLAAAWAARDATAATLARLDALIAQMSSHLAADDPRAYVPANREFHFVVYRAAGSGVLLGIIENLWLQVGPYVGLLRSGSWRTANRQHQAIRDALAHGDGAAAGAAIRTDMEETNGILRRLLGPEGGPARC